jgi:hypothetical protein
MRTHIKYEPTIMNRRRGKEITNEGRRSGKGEGGVELIVITSRWRFFRYHHTGHSSGVPNNKAVSTLLQIIFYTFLRISLSQKLT